MRGTLVHYLDVVPVFAPVEILLHDLELEVGGDAAEGFSEHQCLRAEVGCG